MKQLLLFLYILPATCALAQWEPEVKLNNDAVNAAFIWSNAQRLAANGDTVFVLYLADKNSNGFKELYLERSLNSGLSWEPATELVPDDSSMNGISMAVSASQIHVLWTQSQTGNSNNSLYYKRSDDSGNTWGQAVQLVSGAGVTAPCISVNAQNVHVAWDGTYNNHSEVFYMISVNGGNKWSSETRLTTSDRSFYPVLAVSGDLVHLVFSRDVGAIRYIYYKNSSDGGANWSNEQALSSSDSYSDHSDIAVTGSSVHVVWSDFRNGLWQVYYKHSLSGGKTWLTEQKITEDTDKPGVASITSSGAFVHVIMVGNSGSFQTILYKRSPDMGTSWEQTAQLTPVNEYTRDSPEVITSKDAVHAVWLGKKNGGTVDVYCMRNATGNSEINGISEVNKESGSMIIQNSPNPFHTSTVIKYTVPKAGHVTLKVYNSIGNEIKTLVNEVKPAGNYEVNFGAEGLSKGIYFYSLLTGSNVESRRMVLLK